MSTTSPGGRDAASRLFDNRLKCLIKAAVSEKQQRWYVRRIEYFIKAQSGHKIKALPTGGFARHFAHGWPERGVERPAIRACGV